MKIAPIQSQPSDIGPTTMGFFYPNPKDYKNNLTAEFRIASKDDTRSLAEAFAKHVVPFDSFWPRVLRVGFFGLPGSGKSQMCHYVLAVLAANNNDWQTRDESAYRSASTSYSKKTRWVRHYDGAYLARECKPYPLLDPPPSYSYAAGEKFWKKRRLSGGTDLVEMPAHDRFNREFKYLFEIVPVEVSLKDWEMAGKKRRDDEPEGRVVKLYNDAECHNDESFKRFMQDPDVRSLRIN